MQSPNSTDGPYTKQAPEALILPGSDARPATARNVSRTGLFRSSHRWRPSGHAFRPLRAEKIRRLLAEHGPEIGLTPATSDISDQDAIAAIIQIMGGNFRLLRRLLSQIERILGHQPAEGGDCSRRRGRAGKPCDRDGMTSRVIRAGSGRRCPTNER